MERKAFERLHAATLALLERTGVRVESEAVRSLLAQHGVRVDTATHRVFPSARQVEQALASTPRTCVVYGREGKLPLTFGGDNTYMMSGGSSLRVLTLDGRYEPSTWEHLRQFNVLLDALPNVAMCINQVDPLDDPGANFYRRVAAEMLTGVSKPCVLQAHDADDIRAFAKMGIAIRGSRQAFEARPVFVVGGNSEPPLSISKGVAELTVAACEAGIPASLGNFNMLGITSPVTVAGGVVQLNAVQLAAIVISQAARPGAPFFYTAFSGGGNLRTLEPITSDPPALQLLRSAAGLGRFYGLPVYGMSVTDAKQPDPQAACELAVQLQMAVEVGVHLVQGPHSMMDQMMLSSFTQMVINDDIAGYVLAGHRPLEITDETLALDAIHDVVTDPTLTDLKFAAHPHTVRHLRENLWHPLAFRYENFTNWERAGSSSVAERAAEAARDILDHHRPEPLPREVEAEIRRIAQR